MQVLRSAGAVPPRSHVYGLDVMRAIAILSVLLGHSLDQSTVPSLLLPYERMGIIGVELFFVLSGFLIGGILLRLIESGELQTWRGLARFWQRRWMRTLPMYIVGLLAFLRFDYHGRHSLLDYPSYFIFLQNFGWPIPNFFELSWSLAVEEHFYLWFPFVYLVLSKVVRRREAFVLTALGFIFVAYVFRLSHPLYNDWNEYNANIRLTVLSRLDAIMFGVLVAAIKYRAPYLFSTLLKATPLTATAFGLLCMWWFMGIPHLMNSRLLQLNIFTLQALLGALLLPWFDSLRRDRPINDFFAVTSRLSYSLYLVHILVIVAVNKTLGRLGVYDSVYPNPLLLYPLYLTLFYLVAWITFNLIEKPFLELRDMPFSIRNVARVSSFVAPVLALLVLM